MNQVDIEILRTLGRRIADIAHLPVHRETAAAWRALNGLRPVRPMVMIDQVPWHEMDTDGELTCRCADPWCRGIETRLRRTLYRWEHIPGDLVVEPVIEIPKVILDTGFGVCVDQEIAAVDPANPIVGHRYRDQFTTEAALAKIRSPEVALDTKATAEVESRARTIFDGILDVRMQGRFPSYAMWDLLVSWRSPEAVLYDMIDRPDFLHALAARMAEAYRSLLRQLEDQGLLGTAQQTVHCTGALTDELPASGATPGRSRAKDLWTFGMSQIFSTVSPEMHEAFERPYLSPLFESFGLVYYGCCEPLDRKVDMIRRLPNVRKVSMSPWTDMRRGAEALGPGYVFSRKPSPALLAGDAWNPGAVEKDLRETLSACRANGCPVELILKDISTVRYDPRRLREWNAIAVRLVRDAGA